MDPEDTGKFQNTYHIRELSLSEPEVTDQCREQWKVAARTVLQWLEGEQLLCRAAQLRGGDRR